MADIALTWPELQLAANAAIMRRLAAIYRGRPEPYGKPGAYWDTDINGCIGELALAKHLGIYWEPAVRYPGQQPGDVGLEQVRATTWPNGCLILHPADSDDARYWLALTHALPTVTIYGTIWGAEGKRQEWWRDNIDRPAYFVPQHALEAA